MQYIGYFSELLIKEEARRRREDESQMGESGGVQIMLRNAFLYGALFWIALIAGLLFFHVA